MKIEDIEEPTRCPDENDRASLIEQAHLEECLDRNRCGREKAPDDFDGQHCVDCGDKIHEKRLAHKLFRCIGCQEQKEKMSQHMRRSFYAV